MKIRANPPKAFPTRGIESATTAPHSEGTGQFAVVDVANPSSPTMPHRSGNSVRAARPAPNPSSSPPKVHNMGVSHLPTPPPDQHESAIDIESLELSKASGQKKANNVSVKNGGNNPQCIIDGMPVDTTAITLSQVFLAGFSALLRDSGCAAAGRTTGQLVQHCLPNEIALPISLATAAFNTFCTASIFGAASYDIAPPQYKIAAAIGAVFAALVISAGPLIIPALASSAGTSFGTVATAVAQRQIGNAIYALVRDTVQSALRDWGPRIAFSSTDPENPLGPNWRAIALSSIGYLISAGVLNGVAGNALKEIIETGQGKDGEPLSSTMLRNAANSIGLNAATEGADGMIGTAVRSRFPDAAYSDNVIPHLPLPKDVAFAAVGRVAASNVVHSAETALKLIPGVTPEILSYLVNCLVLPLTEFRGAIVSLARKSVTGSTKSGNFDLYQVGAPEVQGTFRKLDPDHDHIVVDFGSGMSSTVR